LSLNDPSCVKNSTRYNRTWNFGLYGHAESKKLPRARLRAYKDSQSKERQLKPMEGMMRLHSLMIASALAMGLAVPAMAQSSHLVLDVAVPKVRGLRTSGENERWLKCARQGILIEKTMPALLREERWAGMCS
jgi:hypothetical protein